MQSKGLTMISEIKVVLPSEDAGEAFWDWLCNVGETSFLHTLICNRMYEHDSVPNLMVDEQHTTDDVIVFKVSGD